MRDALPRGVTSPGTDPAELLPEPDFLDFDAGGADINQALRVEVVVVALVQGLVAAFATSDRVHCHLSKGDHRDDYRPGGLSGGVSPRHQEDGG